MKQRLFALGMAALILCAGCGGAKGGMLNAADMAENKTASSIGSDTAPNAPAPGGGMDWAAEAGWADNTLYTESGTVRTDSSVYQNAGAKLIRRAEITIQTEQFDQSAAALDQLVEACGGYYESASIYGGSYRDTSARRSGEYVIRVPAEQFKRFQTATGDLGYVTSSTESSEDVGERYHDAEARLKTQRTKQERLLGLLEQAATMEDIISLENALSETEYMIEELSSTLNRYDALISYSTFRIYLNETYKVTAQVGERASLSQRMAAGFAASVDGLFQGGQDLLVWLSYNIFGMAALVVVLIAAGVAGRQIYRRRRKKAAVVPPAPKTPEKDEER